MPEGSIVVEASSNMSLLNALIETIRLVLWYSMLEIWILVGIKIPFPWKWVVGEKILLTRDYSSCDKESLIHKIVELIEVTQ